MTYLTLTQVLRLHERIIAQSGGSVGGFSIIQNHPFVDGNKRTGHATTEIFLILNGLEINASVDEQEQIILQVASGMLTRNEFIAWLKSVIVERNRE